MVQTWETFIPPGKSLKKNILGGGSAKNLGPPVPSRLEDVKIEAKDVNSLQDATFMAVNQANARLVKRTGQAEVASRLESMNKKKEAPSPATSRAKKKRCNDDQGGGAVVDVDAMVMNGDEEDADAILAVFLQKKVKTEPGLTPAQPIVVREEEKQPAMEMVPLPQVMPPSLPILSLEAHQRRDNQLALFALSIERPHRATNDMIINTPPAVGVLNYCSQYKDEMPWFAIMHKVVADSGGRLSFQKIPVFRRSVLVTFLRQPDPKCPYERPCGNLDREPRAHEGKVRCIAHRLSEELWGEGKGFRLREMLFSKEHTEINATLDNNARILRDKTGERIVDPREHLPHIPELCYMCHVWYASQCVAA